MGMEPTAYVNTDRELWRADLQDPLDPDNVYADSVFVTADGRIGIQSGGHVAVNSPRAWVVMSLGSLRLLRVVAEE